MAAVRIIDQTKLPHELITIELKTLDDAAPRHPRYAGARGAADRCATAGPMAWR
ncbi:MAG: hypothetical protein WDN69_18540 [Aliidongia sp.]